MRETENSLPKDADNMYNIKVNRETQKFFVDDEDLNFPEFTDFNFRVLDVYDKLVAYNTEFEVVNETTFFHNLKESKDALGGTTCGRKVYKNETDKLSENEKAINKKKANWYKYIFGIATVKGHPPILADFRLVGFTIGEVIKVLDKIKKEKSEVSRAELRFKAFEETQYDWPNIEVTADFTKTLTVSGLEPFMDSISAYVKTHNSKILQRAANGGELPKKNKFKRRY